MNDMFSTAGSQELLNRKTEDWQHFCDSCLWLGHEGSPPSGMDIWVITRSHSLQIPWPDWANALYPQMIPRSFPQWKNSLGAEGREGEGVISERWEDCSQLRLLLCKSTGAPITAWEIFPISEDNFKDPYLNSNQTSNWIKRKKKAVMKKKISAYRRFQEDGTKVNL